MIKHVIERQLLKIRYKFKIYWAKKNNTYIIPTVLITVIK